jgi:Cdc6-like AAA superfamily ATPase
MQAMFDNKFQLTPKYCQQSSAISPLPTKASDINLFEISAVVYKLLSKRKNHKTFTASLDELDSLLTDSQAINQVALATISKIDYSPNKRLIDECLAKFS